MKHLFIIILIFTFACNRQSNQLSKEDLAQIKQAQIYLDSKKNLEAIKVVKELIKKSHEANYITACAYKNIKQYNNAELFFKKVYLLKPSYKYTRLYLAQIILKKIDLNKPATTNSVAIQSESIRLLTEGINNKDSIPQDMLARYYATRGQLIQLQGNFINAIKDFTIAINLDPQGDYYSRRAMSYYFNGQNELACSDFKKGQELGEKYNENEINKICR